MSAQVSTQPMEWSHSQTNRRQASFTIPTPSRPSQDTRRCSEARAEEICSRSSRTEASAAGGSARTTTRDPAGSSERSGRTASRSRRLTRCRVTEFPTALPTVNPTRARSGDGACAPGEQWTTTAERPARSPERVVDRKSAERRSRWPAGSTVGPWRLGREADAALGAPRGEHRTARTGAHPSPEAVRLGATTVVRLEGALHDRAPAGS